MERVEGIVRANGKQMIGWGEIAPAKLNTRTLVQHWRSDAVASRDSAWLHADRGGVDHPVAGQPHVPRHEVRQHHHARPQVGRPDLGGACVLVGAEHVPQEGARPAAVLGVEAPLWAETVEKLSDYQFLAFPRLIAIAELGWSRPEDRGWTGFRARLAEHGPRLQALGVNFYRSPEIPWR